LIYPLNYLKINEMNKNDYHSQNFRELTVDEAIICNGGSFAYDVGRLIRFVGISGPSGLFTPMAIMDAGASPYR